METASTPGLQLGQFALIEKVGSGGMADVWSARHASVPDLVAVKVITSDLAGDERIVDAFEHEIRAVAALDHPGIVRVLDFGRVDPGEAAASNGELQPGNPYLAMELATGGSLEDPGSVASWEVLRALVLQVLDALAYSHARNLIHKDLKPANILRVAPGSLSFKLSDFGVAHAHGATQIRDDGSVPGEAAGTPLYMPYEQLVGRWRDFGPWTDLYALGGTVYDLVCGHPPFQAANLFLLAQEHANAPRPALEPIFAVPAGLQAWVTRLLGAVPSARFRSAAAAARAFLELPETVEQGIAETAELGGVLTTAAPAPSPNAEAQAAALQASATWVESLSDTLGVAGSTHMARTLAENQRGVPEETQRMLGIPDVVRARAVGLGLFALREHAFVGRVREQEKLWQLARRAWDGERSSAVVIRGPRTVGKTSLAKVFAMKAAQREGAVVFQARHTQLAAESEGLSQLVRDYFSAWRLTRKSAETRVREVVESDAPELRTSGPWSDREIRTLASLIAPASMDERAASLPFSRDEQHQGVRRLIGAAAETGPVILILDDAQFSVDSIFFARRSVGKTVSLFTIVVVDDSAVPEHVLEELERFEELEDVATIDLRPLAATSQRRFVDSLLEWTPETSSRLAEQTGSSPMLAVQTVLDAIEMDRVETTPDGFQLPEITLSRLDGRLEPVIGRRLRRAFQGDDEGWEVLALCAALGNELRSSEFAAVCENGGHAAATRVMVRLAGLGFARSTEDGWSLPHSSLQGCIEFSAGAAMMAAAHRACAETLGELYPWRTDANQGRIGEHLARGGKTEEAAWRFFWASYYAVGRGEYGFAIAYATRAKELDNAGDAKTRNKALSALIDRRRGHPERARKTLISAVVAAAADGVDPITAGFVNHISGMVFRADSNFERSLAAVRRACDLFAAAGEQTMLGQAVLGLGSTLHVQGDLPAARVELMRAVELFRELGATYRVSDALAQLASLCVATLEWDLAEQWAHETIALGGLADNIPAESDGYNTLGEVARFRGDFPAAAEYYERAGQLYRACGESVIIHILDQNTATALVGAGRLAEAESLLDTAEAGLVAGGYNPTIPAVHLTRMWIAGIRGDAEAWDDAHEQAKHWAEVTGRLCADFAWLSERAAETAPSPERARAIAGFSLAQNEGLNRADAVERLTTKFGLGDESQA